MEVLQLLARKGQPPAPSNPSKGITHPNSRSGMWQHWQIRISSPSICLDPRFHFSLLERLGLAANIRCRHRFGTQSIPFPAASSTKILIQAHLQMLKKLQFCNRVHPSGAHHETKPSWREKNPTTNQELLLITLSQQTKAIDKCDYTHKNLLAPN